MSVVVPEDEVKCETTAEQLVNVCLPVEVKPTAKVGKISTICCGPARVTSGIKPFNGESNENCDFTICKKICVKVPVEFGATVKPGEPHTQCEGEKCGDECEKTA